MEIYESFGSDFRFYAQSVTPVSTPVKRDMLHYRFRINNNWVHVKFLSAETLCPKTYHGLQFEPMVEDRWNDADEFMVNSLRETVNTVNVGAMREREEMAYREILNKGTEGQLPIVPETTEFLWKL